MDLRNLAAFFGGILLIAFLALMMNTAEGATLKNRKVPLYTADAQTGTVAVLLIDVPEALNFVACFNVVRMEGIDPSALECLRPALLLKNGYMVTEKVPYKINVKVRS